MRFIDQEQELKRELPKVFGNADYREYVGQLDQIDGLLVRSGIETHFVEMRLAAWEQTGGRLGVKARLRYQTMCIQALRAGIARQMTEREYRKFAMRLAESFVLQRFCQMGELEGVTIPSNVHRDDAGTASGGFGKTAQAGIAQDEAAGEGCAQPCATVCVPAES